MGKALGGTALGFGIGSILLGWVPVLGWLIALAAIIIAMVAMVKCKTPEEGRGLAIAGLVTSIVGIVLIPVWYLALGLAAYHNILAPDRVVPETATQERLPAPIVNKPATRSTVQLSGANPLMKDISLDLCTKHISYPQTINSCIITDFARRARDISICDKMYSQDHNAAYQYAAADRDRCYNIVAYELEDTAVCDKISDPTNKASCLDGVQNSLRGTAFCDEQIYNVSRDSCYARVAQHRLDPSICDRIPNVIEQIPTPNGFVEREVMSDTKRFCYNDIIRDRAIGTRNVTICDEISDSVYRDNCYSHFAGVWQDPAICGRIVNDISKRTCKEITT